MKNECQFFFSAKISSIKKIRVGRLYLFKNKNNVINIKWSAPWARRSHFGIVVEPHLILCMAKIRMKQVKRDHL